MTRITQDRLYELLPAIHRLRDAEEGEPLRALIGVLAREGAVIEDGIEQLLDDLFIETCAPWAAPYIGALVGYEPLHPVDGLVAGTRAEVANTIAYRRRKGTLAVLEQLARDVTGWPARAVEYMQHTATCQHVNVTRPNHHATPDLRNPLNTERLGDAFDGVTRSVDLRSIQQGQGRKSVGGRHNFPNIGLHLWRLGAQRLTDAPTLRVDARRYLFDALGAPRQLINRQEAERDLATLAQPVNVPGAITRRILGENPALWMRGTRDGPLRAFDILVDGVPVPTTRIEACDLSDDGAGWNHTPHDAIDPVDLAAIEGAPGPESPAPNALVRVDPELGRIAFPNPESGEVRVTFHTAFPAPIGGGEYNRARSLVPPVGGGTLLRHPSGGHASVQDALDALPPEGGIVEIETNDVFDAPTRITAEAATEITLRAADGVRPILRAAAPIEISGGADARVALNGVIVEGDAVHVLPDSEGTSLGALTLAHVTLIPGLGLTPAGAPRNPGAPSLLITATGVETLIERSITGPIRTSDTTNLTARDSIIDAAAAQPSDSAEGLAIAGPGGADGPAGALTLLASTVIGRIHCRAFPLVSDAILHARDDGSGTAPVRSLRRQQGCIRYSYVPTDAITPRRYRCQPQLAIQQAMAAHEGATGAPPDAAQTARITARVSRRIQPGFTALAYSASAYAQLRSSTPQAIRAGAEDEGEMGAMNLLFQPQREANLRIRLDEYLRFGLEAGLFFET